MRTAARPSTGRVWTVCAQRRGTFSAQARAGGKRALWGREGSAYLAKSRLPGVHYRGASGPRRRDRPSEWRWRRLVGDSDVEVLRAGRYGREWWCWRVGTATAGMAVPPGVTARAGSKGWKRITLFAQPVVNMLHRFHDRCQLINSKDFAAFDVAR